MNIKQKIVFAALVLCVSVLGSALVSPTTSALTKSKFASILCDDFQGPVAGGGTVADQCRKDANDGELGKKWYDKVIKFADWKDKTANQLRQHVGKTPAEDPADEEPADSTPADEDCTDCILNDPVAGDDCGGVETAIIKCDAQNSGDVSDNGIWALLLIAINIMTAGVGVLAVAGIVYGSIMYTTAEDKADQVKKATDIITNVVIGLVVFALMWAGLNFLIPGGVFA